jgi:hypothetical protein
VCFRTFVELDRIPLSATNNDDTHADVGDTFMGDRSNTGDVSL